MKALFYISREIKEENILYGLLELDIDTHKSDLVVELDDIIEGQVETITKEVAEYDFVITRSFSVNVAEGCHHAGVSYIAWCYDSPVRALYTSEALYPTNFIFVFDKKQMKRLEEIGLRNIFYQPLAANMITASMVSITKSDLRKNKRDISFVGSTYDRGYYGSLIKRVDSLVNEECEKLFDEVLCKWGVGYNVFDRIGDRAINELYAFLSKKNRDIYSISDRYLTEVLVLVYELTARERVFLLNKAAEHYNTIIHTNDCEKYKDIYKCEVRGTVKELSEELYRIYAASKINLNITMRSIETGVPQRVFDIMSVGGCVFSNYQEEACELFEPDREIVLFGSADEFIEKAGYYITNEKQRLEIGARAYLKVRDKYNYRNAIANMIRKL